MGKLQEDKESVGGVQQIPGIFPHQEKVLVGPVELEQEELFPGLLLLEATVQESILPVAARPLPCVHTGEEASPSWCTWQ